MHKLLTRLFTALLLSGFLQTVAVATYAKTSDPDNAGTMAEVIASRTEKDRARDSARHPAETLQFFQVEPGMTVAEGLPGGGWYTTILANYLGKDGTLFGVNYADRMWSMFSFASPEFIATRLAATAEFDTQVAGLTDNGIHARGFTFEAVPAEIVGTVDRVLLIRALHNLNRFEAAAGTRSKGLVGVHAMLKTGGLVGVVQHRAPATASDESADGHRGYMKQAAVIRMFEAAGFALVASSEINANPKDQPAAEDIVWRLPPSLRGSEAGSKEREALQAIGESDRMTLLFRKT